ncbi:uncharacterized protein LOC129582257 [Paramacrobiotus metropolitanus]|uniref:uncharacterized protein LOC129582257 n=1 Tax=Paramacrobiotus metropolitanus TaxID=2943436 RepID=UPI002445C76F|nr:uncharacterized protein LOC129582257 [Paramacrobiotus metropolitanus]
MSGTMATLWNLLVLLIFHLTTAKHDGKFTESDPEPLPVFSSEPMALAQCASQFSANCQPGVFGVIGCPFFPALYINCTLNATAQEIRQMTVSMAKPPLRAVFVNVLDGDQVNFDNFAPVRQQIMGFDLAHCVSSRATGRLASLRLTNLLDIEIGSCRSLEIKRADFWPTRQVRWIQFYNTTISLLEKGTFTDLPALRLLALESWLSDEDEFSDGIREYIKNMHCGCEFEWFRRWWDQKRLLHKAKQFEVYQIQPFFVGNVELNKSQVYLPVDCAAAVFPTGPDGIDFTQDGFSINDDADHNKWGGRCSADKENGEPFPEVSIDPLTPEECAVQLIGHCGQQGNFCNTNPVTSTPFSYDILDEKIKGTENCALGSTIERIRRVAIAMVKLPVRPILLMLYDKTPVTFSDVAPMRKRIVIFCLVESITERTTQKLQDLRLTNLLDFQIMNSTDLVIRKSDFQFSGKLRIFQLRNTTVRSLEENAFSDLPALVALSLEFHFDELPGFDQRIRSYLLNLHCSCEFAWYRKWWSNNSALLRETVFTGIYYMVNAYGSAPFERKNVYVPIDCAKNVPAGPDSVNWNQTDFSLNDSC